MRFLWKSGVNGPYLSIHEKNLVSHILGLKTEKKCFSDI